jgi:hypothetical protein
VKQFRRKNGIIRSFSELVSQKLRNQAGVSLVQIRPNPAFAREKGVLHFFKRIGTRVATVSECRGGKLLISVDSPSTQGILP